MSNEEPKTNENQGPETDQIGVVIANHDSISEARISGRTPSGSRSVDVEIFKELGTYERHFNQMQSVCRGFASTWLLATFGGIGYSLWNSNFWTRLIEMRAAAGSLVALAGGTGIFVLWLIDIVVYHRLLVAVTYEAGDLEAAMGLGLNLRGKFRNAANAPIRVLGIEFFRNEGARKIIATFYWLPSLFLLAIAVTLHCSAWNFEPIPIRFAITGWQLLVLACVIIMIFNRNPTKAETTGSPLGLSDV
jgi:hypothetical protein